MWNEDDDFSEKNMQYCPNYNENFERFNTVQLSNPALNLSM